MSKKPETKFHIIKTKGQEAVYVNSRLAGHSWRAPYSHPHGDCWLSLLYANSHAPQLTDQQMLEIGEAVFRSYREGHRAGQSHKAKKLRELLEVAQ